MLTPDQKAHFEAFGFLAVRQAFSPAEVKEIIEESERLWEADRDGAPRGDKGQHMSKFVEHSPVLTRIVDERIREGVEDLIGADFMWAGSEGNFTVNNAHGWHNDRPAETESELAFTRLKVNIYLDPVTKDTGALRVLPGSHRPLFHMGLAPLEKHHHEKGDRDALSTPYGLSGPDMPFYAFESEPGDVVFFNQTLFHAVFNGFAGRRYIALKFAAMPTTDEQFEMLKETSGFAFQLHQAFADSELPKVRAMGDRLAAAALRAAVQ